MPPPEPARDAPPSVATCTELLQGLRVQDEAAWSRFVERYRPVVLGWAERAGLSRDDAEDVTQSALADFTRAYREGRYDRDQGRLRAWLLGIARNELARWWRARPDRELPAGAAATTGGVLASLPSPDEQQALWEGEWRSAVLSEAMDAIRREVQPSTWRAFELFALEIRPAHEVAAELELSENAVYGAKRRVLQRLREVLPVLEDQW